MLQRYIQSRQPSHTDNEKTSSAVTDVPSTRVEKSRLRLEAAEEGVSLDSSPSQVFFTKLQMLSRFYLPGKVPVPISVLKRV